MCVSACGILIRVVLLSNDSWKQSALVSLKELNSVVVQWLGMMQISIYFQMLNLKLKLVSTDC